MKNCNSSFSCNILNGIISGVIAGAIFTIFLIKNGMLPVLGHMINNPTVVGGLIVHTVMSLAVGIVFALALHKVVKNIGIGILFGILAGVGLFLAGPMTMMPTMIDHAPLFDKWNLTAFAEAKAVLMGHIVFGIILGGVYGYLNKE